MILLSILFLVFLHLPLSYTYWNLVILHTAGIRGRFDEIKMGNDGFCYHKPKERGQCFGGVPRMSAVIEARRREYTDGRGAKPLFFYSGSIFTGSVWFRIHRANISAKFLNYLKPDAVSLGKSEFHYGIEELAAYVNQLTVPVLCANIKRDMTFPLNKIENSTIIKIQGTRISIGVIGFLTHKVKHKIENLNFGDEIHAVKEESIRLRNEGVSVIIAMGSAPHDVLKQMAKEASLVNIIIGPGNHLFWNRDREVQPEMIRVEGPYPVVQNGALIIDVLPHSKYIGQLEINFLDNGKIFSYKGQPIFLSRDMPKDKNAEALLKEFEPDVLAATRDNLTFTKTVLLGGNNLCRKQECNFGNLIADAYVAYISNQTKYSKESWTYAAIAFVIGGAIASDITPSDNDGNITLADLYNACPYNDSVASFSMTGENLMKTLQHGVDEINSGAFLQFSGIHIIIDDRNKRGSKVISAKVRCGQCLIPKYEPIQQNKTYNIITILYLLETDSKHSIVRKNHFNTKIWATNLEVLKWYLGRNAYLYPQEEGRITYVPYMQTSSPKTLSISTYLITMSILFARAFE